jgi:hypothetical protein
MKLIAFIVVLMSAASLALGTILPRAEPDTALTVSAKCVDGERKCTVDHGAIDTCRDGKWHVARVCESFHFCDPVFINCLRESLAAHSAEGAASKLVKEEVIFKV